MSWTLSTDILAKDSLQCLEKVDEKAKEKEEEEGEERDDFFLKIRK